MKNVRGKVLDFSDRFNLCCMGNVGQTVKSADLFQMERNKGGC